MSNFFLINFSGIREQKSIADSIIETLSHVDQILVFPCQEKNDRVIINKFLNAT